MNRINRKKLFRKPLRACVVSEIWTGSILKEKSLIPVAYDSNTVTVAWVKHDWLKISLIENRGKHLQQPMISFEDHSSIRVSAYKHNHARMAFNKERRYIKNYFLGTIGTCYKNLGSYF